VEATSWSTGLRNPDRAYWRIGLDLLPALPGTIRAGASAARLGAEQLAEFTPSSSPGWPPTLKALLGPPGPSGPRDRPELAPDVRKHPSSSVGVGSRRRQPQAAASPGVRVPDKQGIQPGVGRQGGGLPASSKVDQAEGFPSRGHGGIEGCASCSCPVRRSLMQRSVGTSAAPGLASEGGQLLCRCCCRGSWRSGVEARRQA